MSTSRRAEVLAALLDAGGGTVSGEELAARMGVSRVAVGKHVARLRDLGYEIVPVPGKGYRLARSADALSAEEIAARVRSARVTSVTGGGTTGSTNDDARRLATAGVPEIAVAVASEQTAGRGRLGRSWESPRGGVYASFVLRPSLPLVELTPLPLVVGVGVARGLELLGVRAHLKWPNDVMVGGGKLGGVLLEVAAESDRASWVVAGIGLNVRAPAPDARAPDAVHLEDLACNPSLSDAVVALIDGVADVYGEFLDSGFAQLREEYDRRHVLAGTDVAVRDLCGELVVEGRVSGVDELGRLLLDTADGPRSVASGDVTLRSP